MKFSQRAILGMAILIAAFGGGVSNAAAIPCECHRDHQGYLQCVCDPQNPDGGGGGSCTANPAACSQDELQLLIELPAETAAIVCPPDSCNPANGCVDGCR